jgi:hypothetical protein
MNESGKSADASMLNQIERDSPEHKVLLFLRIAGKCVYWLNLGTYVCLVKGEFIANRNSEYGSDSNSVNFLLIFSYSLLT